MEERGKRKKGVSPSGNRGFGRRRRKGKDQCRIRWLGAGCAPCTYGGGANTKLFLSHFDLRGRNGKKGGGTFSRSENDNGGEGRKKVSWFRGGA